MDPFDGNFLQPLVVIEGYCKTLYTSDVSAERLKAERQLEQIIPSYLDNPIRYPHQALRSIQIANLVLFSSNNHYALVYACQRVNVISMHFFPAFDIETKANIRKRQTILNVLSARPDLPSFVILALARLFATVTKMGWFDDPVFRAVNADVAKFLENDPNYRTIGLQLLATLIDDISVSPTPPILQASFNEKLVAAEFVTSHLLDAFMMAYTKLTEVLTYGEMVGMLSQLKVGSLTKYVDGLLSLVKACVSFDFLASQVSGEPDENRATQFPATWKPLLLEPSFIPSLFSLYRKLAAPQSHKVLSCLVDVVGARRSMFHEDEARKFVLSVIHEFSELLQSGHGLEDPDNHHEFCRALARFRSAFHLSDVADREIYWKWVKGLGDFTISSLNRWELYPNSLPYLMGVWVRIVASSWNLSPGNSETMMGAEFHAIPSQIFSVFLESRLGHVEQMLDPEYCYEDMFDRPELEETLGHIAAIARYRYALSCDLLVNAHTEVMRSYDEALIDAAPDVANPELQICEGKLAWLVYTTGALLGERLTHHPVDEEDLVDAEIAARMFRLVEPTHSLVGHLGRRMATRQTLQLNLALLYFFDSFQASYICHVSTRSSLVYTRMAQFSTIQDSGMALQVILQRIVVNLQNRWDGDDKLTGLSIRLLKRLAAGYHAARQLRRLDPADFLLTHHAAHHFAFMLNPANLSHRARFYEALGRILFAGEDVSPLLDEFLAVFDAPFQALAALRDPADYFLDTIKFSVSGLARDLQGLFLAAATRKSFLLLFDWFNSHPAQPLARAFQVYAEATEVDPESLVVPLVALLKFYGELTLNRTQRLNFPVESAGGVILFRQARAVGRLTNRVAQRVSRVCGSVGSVPPSHIKLVIGYLRLMGHLLRGNYVCFGIFAVYDDPALTNFYRAYFKILNALSPQEIFAHPKLCVLYFELLELFLENHLDSVGLMDRHAFAVINQVLAQGVQNPSVPQISTSVCRSIDHILSLLCEHKAQGVTHPLHQLYAAHDELLAQLFDSLFSAILYSERGNLWAFARPLLSFLTYDRSLFVDFSRRLLERQLEPSRPQLEELLSKLVEGVGEGEEPKMKELLSNRLTSFSQSVHSNQMAIIPLPPEPFLPFSLKRLVPRAKRFTLECVNLTSPAHPNKVECWSPLRSSEKGGYWPVSNPTPHPQKIGMAIAKPNVLRP
ncbi:Exportin 7 [Massospora cicadina]|nr:Exportin 7 [Massospora cicadina]